MNRDQEFTDLLDDFSRDCRKANLTVLGGLPFIVAVAALSDAFGPTPFLGVILIGALAAPILGSIEFNAALKKNDREWEAYKRKHYGFLFE